MVDFAGKVTLNDDEPVKLRKHAPIKPDTSDPRINVLKEYISKVPDATIQNLKKALTHFSKSTDEEFRNLVKSANIDKYNELYPIVKSNKSINVISTEHIPFNSTYGDDEINLLKAHIELPPRHFYKLYKEAFPNSERSDRFVKDLRYLLKTSPERYKKDAIKRTRGGNRHSPKPTHAVTPLTTPSSNHSLVAQTIRSLYKAGVTPEMLPKVKPVLNELMAQNSNQDEIALAIAYLKN